MSAIESNRSNPFAAFRAAVVACFLAPTLAAQTQLVDVDILGSPVTMNTHERMSVSTDGRYVAFTAFNMAGGQLVPGVDPGPYRVYLRDTQTGTTILVSKNSAGGVPNSGGSSFLGSMSADGRYVVFTSSAMLTPNAPPGFADAAYIFDRVTDAVELVSVSSAGVGSAGEFSTYSRTPLVTPDGRYVLFESVEPLTADAGPSTTIRRVYRRDRVAQQTILISELPGGASPPHARAGGITADGSRMLYQCVGSVGSAPVPGVYIRDLTLDVHQRIDVDQHSIPLNGVVGSSVGTSLDWTADGARVVVAGSSQTNPTIGDVDAYSDIYLIDWLAGNVQIVSKQMNGANSLSNCSEPSISDDGRYVVFEVQGFAAQGTDLVPWDQTGGSTNDIVLRDLVTQRNAIVNVSTFGAQSTGDHKDPVISGDGRFVVFTGLGSGLVPGVSGTHYYHRARTGFTKLGYGKPGSGHAAPQLNGSGSTEPGGSGTLFLTIGTPFAQSLLFVAIDRSYLAPTSGPFKGTVLVTAAPMLVIPLPVDAFGQFFVPYTLPNNLPLPPEVYLQCAMPDPLAISGVAVSSALLMGM